VSLQQALRVVHSSDGRALNDEAIEVWTETEKTLFGQKMLIDSLPCSEAIKNTMHLRIPPDESVGVSLDKGVYEMLVSKQKGFRDDQDMARRNELKDRIVRLGHIQQPHGGFAALEVHFRRLFSNIKYSVADMMKQLTDQYDLTEI
jgi:ATP-dependent RNA helicase DDX60